MSRRWRRNAKVVPRKPRFWQAGERCPVDGCPAPGDVGADYRAVCFLCGKRVGVSKRCLYLPHKSPKQQADTPKEKP